MCQIKFTSHEVHHCLLSTTLLLTICFPLIHFFCLFVLLLTYLLSCCALGLLGSFAVFLIGRNADFLIGRYLLKLLNFRLAIFFILWSDCSIFYSTLNMAYSTCVYSTCMFVLALFRSIPVNRLQQIIEVLESDIVVR